MGANRGSSAGRFDVVVAGGGPAGAATALALVGGDPSIRIALIAGPAGGPGNGETLTPDALPLLDRLGVGEAFRDAGPLPSLGTRSCWGSETPYDNEAIFSPIGPGWRIDRAWFDAWLLSAAAARGVSVHEGAIVRDVSRAESGRWTVLVDSPATGGPIGLDAAFLVDATGRRAALARRLGARVRYLDRLVGLAVSLASPDTDGVTLVEAGEEGWWYSFSVADSRRLVVLMSDSDLVKARRLTLPERWHEALSRTRLVSGPASAGVPLGPPRVLSAQTRRLDRCAGAGWRLAIRRPRSTRYPLREWSRRYDPPSWAPMPPGTPWEGMGQAPSSSSG